MIKRIFSLLLCLALCLSIFPVGAFAAEEEATAEMAEELHEEFIPVEEPVVAEPSAEEPVVEEPPAEEPVVEEPPAEEIPVEEPIKEEPTEEEPPVEEPVVEEPPEEEPVVAELPAGELEVTFECAEAVDLSALTVLDAKGAVVPPRADAATGAAIYGTYSLLPGEYSYSFSAEGFEPLVNQTFTVEDSARTFTIVLTALKTEVEPSVEETSEEETPEEEISVEDPIVTETPEGNTAVTEPSEEELHPQEPALTEGGKTTEPSSAEELGLKEASLLAAPMLAALPNNAPTENLEITYTDLQELLDENESIKLSALFSALSLSVEMAEVAAVEVSDPSVFTVVKDAEGGDWSVNVLQAPDTQALVYVTVGTLEYNIVVTNDVGKIKKESVKYIDVNGVEQTATCIMVDVDTEWLGDGWYAVDGNVDYHDIKVGYNAHLILKDGCKLYPREYTNRFQFQNGANLTIYGQKDGSGRFELQIEHQGKAKLTVNGGEVQASSLGFSFIEVNRGRVIAGNISCDELVVDGGVVTAQGANGSAGISCQNVTINGGTVTANGGERGAGIGGNAGGNGGTVTINGGTVTANGGFNAAGIGGGEFGNGGSVTISGGTVTANGGRRGAGIGGGSKGDGVTFIISGGTVTAVGGYECEKGIGAGADRSYSGIFSVENAGLAVFAGESGEGAHSTTAAEYSTTRDKFVCIGPRVEYTVSHQWQTADGTGYEQKESETLYGIAGLRTEAQQKSYEGFTCQAWTQLPVVKDLILPIKYNRNLYEIVFDNNSIGPQPHDITARYGATVTVDPGTLSAEGYVFNGWFEDEACTKPFAVPQTIPMPLNGMILHAGWAGIKDTPYTVEHWQQKADGTGYELTETTHMTGTSGEYTAAEAKTYPGFTAEEFTQLPISGYGITVVKIKYTRNSYTITFNANGHGTAPAALTALYGAPVIKPADPAETGYTFGGWFEDESCTKAFTFTVMPLGGKTLYAKWTANVYAVTFDGNFTGSAYSQVIQQTYGETYIFPEDDPEREGYNFTGWYTKAAKGEEIEEGDKFPYSDEFDTLTVFAHWKLAKHIYGPATYVWTGDSCTASRTCTKCPEPHTQTETVTGIYVEDTPAACLTASKGHYRAVFKSSAFAEQNTAPNSVTNGTALGHSYGEASYAWSDDHRCTASHTCTRCTEGTQGHTETETVTGTYVKDTDATCTTAEKGHHKATFNNTAFTAQSTARNSFTKGEPLGHSYGDPFYAWKDDQCTANRICTRCTEGTDGHTETETVTGTYVEDTPAACLTASKGHYKAAFKTTAFTEQNTAKGSVTKGDPLGHGYGAASYTWNNDKCTGSRLCTRCGHTETETAGSYVKDTDATCTAAEKGHYKAVFKNTAFAEQNTATDSVTKGEPLGHAFPDKWLQFGAQQHMRQCDRCRIYDFGDHDFNGGDPCTECKYAQKTLQISVSGGPYCAGNSTEVGPLTFTSDKVSYQLIDPKWCVEEPTMDYLESFDDLDLEPGEVLEAGRTYVAQLKVTVSPPDDNLNLPEIISDFFIVGCSEPELQDDGSYVMDLVLLFTLEPPHAGLTQVSGKPATCTEAGLKDCWHCLACGRYYEDKACQTLIANYEVWQKGAGIIPASHSYGSASYAWGDKDDKDKCTATHTCTKCPYTDSETVTGTYVKDTDATCTTAEKGHYRAVFTNTAFTEQNTDRNSVTIIGTELGHSYGTPSYEWNDDHQCTATHSCTRCTVGTDGHTEEETVTGTYVKDTDATCTAAETGHYKATFTKAGFTVQSTARGSVIIGEPLGHSYGEASYTWDGDKCTAARICTRCSYADSETVTGTYVKDTDATCTAAEKGHYKAVFKNAAFTEQTTAAGSVTKGDPLGHAFPDTWQPYSAQQHVHQCTREGCQAYDYAAHRFHGNTCTACGYAKSDRYLIIYGAEGVWTQRSGNALPFTSDAPFDRFVSVNVDGIDIPGDCYTAAEGSTKVNLLPAYLETLSVGQHSLDIVSNDGVASTTFTVKAAPVYYTVSFNMCGHGTQVAAQRVEKGNKVSEPVAPSASGYIFYGWYTDAAYKTKYNFRTPVNGNLTLYARWVSSTDPGSPKTGDNGQLALWAVMLSASTVALAGTAALAKKKKQEE